MADVQHTLRYVLVNALDLNRNNCTSVTNCLFSTGEEDYGVFTPDGNISCIETMYVRCAEPATFEPTVYTTYNVAMLSMKRWMKGYRFFNFSTCVYSRCRFQDSRIDQSTHMVVMEISDIDDQYQAISRWPHQLYVATSWEPPPHLNSEIKLDRNYFWNSRFNLTSSYRTDSDIFVPYGMLRFKPIPVDSRPNYFEIANRKTNWVAWFVSNCNTSSKRHLYVQKMKKIIHVDIYGRCGRRCPDTYPQCSESRFSQYRYYLSFENNFCKDYITEKFFKVFRSGMHIIPVVRGAFDYHKYMPAMTYVDTGTFRDAIELAKFLKRLGENPVAYARYLERKSMYEYMNDSSLESLGCQACMYLHTHTLQSKIEDLKKVIVDNQCYAPTDLI
ncbi:alpha-(1,3)-fucosyltransferase C [Biomphalaria glabrata]|nr:alpha-(1,3)-fucosyltransferase C [Biomphalaria glabrata]